MDTTTTTQAAWVVLARYEQNLYHDSYFYEIVWDGERVRVVETGATAYAGGFWSGNPQASPEQDRAARETFIERVTQVLTEQAEARAKEPDVGRTVRSLTTRGKNFGFTGVVVRIKTENLYRPGVLRVQVRAEDGRETWMDVDRLEVTGGVPPIDYAEIRRAAVWRALNANWRSLVNTGL